MNALKPFPVQCEPLPKAKVWGGRRLTELFGKQPAPGADNIGETWEVADLEEGASLAANGPLAGSTLTEAVRRAPEMMLGRAAPWERFPLLVKFIDAAADLSIQVHPDAETCRKHFPQERSKDESWVVVDARPGADILAGVKPGVDREQIEAAVRGGDAVECFHALPVKRGDVIRIAPGTVHALRRGVVVLEIQEPSDTTFRLYDYGRVDASGKPRPLHVQQALQSLHLTTPSLARPVATEVEWGRRETLATAPVYRIERWQVRAPFAWRLDEELPRVLVCLAGEIRLTGGAETVVARPGAAVVLPAGLDQLRLDPVAESQLVAAAPVRPG